MQFSSDSAALVGMAVVAAGFALLAAFELALPFRSNSQPRGKRWLTNLALFAIDTLAVRLLLPFAMVGAAALAAERGWGLFHAIAAPGWVQFVVTLLALDLAIFLQHWATHKVPLLWRLHRVHHTDRDFDLTTGARFHPVEILLSTIYKAAVIALLGLPVLAVLVFEAGFAVLTLFTHANVALPARAERWVRAVLVTPSMHRIHHSVRRRETDSNYGTFLSLWDRLFGTYTAQPQGPPQTMPIGLAEWQDERPARLGFSLLLPFQRK